MRKETTGKAKPNKSKTTLRIVDTCKNICKSKKDSSAEKSKKIISTFLEEYRVAESYCRCNPKFYNSEIENIESAKDAVFNSGMVPAEAELFFLVPSPIQKI